MKDFFHKIKRTFLGASFCFAALTLANTNDVSTDDEIKTKDRHNSEVPSDTDQTQKPHQKTQRSIKKKTNVTTTTTRATTADDQAKGSDQDVSITRQIRSSLVGDPDLSTSAKNINITTINGKVTLRGTVNDQKEYSAVKLHARNVVSETKINNLVEIKP